MMLDILEAIADSLSFDRGDSVAVGWVKDSCGRCEHCLVGHNAHCRIMAEYRSYLFTDHNQSTLSSHSIWPEHNLHKLPDDIDSVHAGPLACAGMTVFKVLIEYGVLPTDTVGVVGIGGLGHLAIQFAHHWGCKVVVVSSNENKREEAMKLGADEFYTPDQIKKDGTKEILDSLIVASRRLPGYDL